MNRNRQTIDGTSWGRIAILGGLIVASWILAIVLLPGLRGGGQAPASPTPTQVVVPSSTAQVTPSATGTSTATGVTPSTATATVSAPTLTSTPTVSAAAYCFATADQLNVRSGPGTTYSVLLQLQAIEQVTPIARNSDGTWVQAIVRGGVQGWISATYLSCEGINIMSLPVVAVVPTPTQAQTAVAPTRTPAPQPTSPQSFRNWRGEYYGNTSLAGPAVLRDDAQVSYDWGSGSPVAGVPADNWSARWTRDLNLGTGLTRFQVRADDGVRLWVDGRLIIDQWHPANATYTAEVYLSGERHNVRLEYVEYGGNASVFLSWQRVDQTFRNWRGAYYGNTDLSGNPVLVRDDENIGFEWGNGSPAPGVPTDRFSVRWTRNVAFSEGRYRFRVEADDGVRLWVAGNLIIDRWQGGSRVSSVDQRIWTGTHEVVLEYFELEGGAKAKLSWEKLTEARTPTSTTPTRTPVITEWRAEYYNNERLEGAPRVVRNEREISFDWRNNAPVPQVGRDRFSARFTRQLELPGGTYRWSAAADDGVRVYIDNQLIIDAWQEGPLTEHVTQVVLAQGAHTVRIEYMESTGFAALYVHWERLAPTVTPTGTLAPPTATATGVPPTATATTVPPTATATGVPPTATATTVPPTATATGVPPTATATGVPPTATATMVPPTATATGVPPTATATTVPPTATATGVPPTATATTVPPTATATGVPPTATATPTIPAGSGVAYRTLLQGNQSFKFVRQTAYEVFSSRSGWDAWVEGQGGEPVSLPGVDWGNEVVIVAFLDPQLDRDPDGSTLGVEITRVWVEGDNVKVEVAVRTVTPPSSQPGARVRPKDGPTVQRTLPGTPYHIVVAKRADLPGRTRVPVLFQNVAGQFLAADILTPGADLETGPEVPRGIQRSKEP